MIREVLETATGFVTRRNRVTLLVMVLLSAAVLAGIPQLDTGSEAGADEDAFDDLERVEAMEYVQENYTEDTGHENRTIQTVYVWEEESNVLSKASLLEGLRYQQDVTDNASVQATLGEDGIAGLENLVTMRLAGSPDATLAEQVSALESASESEVEQAVAATLEEDPRAQRFLPSDHDPDQTTATDRRTLVAMDTSVADGTLTEANAALYEVAQERSDAGFFTFTQQAYTEANEHFFSQMVQLVVPISLLLILVVLAFTYRDVVDIVVGMAGVVLSIGWMFGIMGWIGVAAGLISIIPVVLITGLSIDFGFHVFNRYREERGETDGIRESMHRGTLLVATALVLVTVTAAIGFMANVVNPLAQIRNLGISITLGVVSAFVIFVTVVPALKVSVDGLLERFGVDRRKAALGRGTYLAPVLRQSVTLARRAAPVVVLVAVVAGAAGGVAWTELDREQFDRGDDGIAEWKQQLPGPLGWDRHELAVQDDHVSDRYQPASESDAVQSMILLKGDVTADDTLESIHSGVQDVEAEDESLLVDQAGTQSVRSPVTAMQAVAERDDSFAEVFEASDTDGNGVPDSDLERVYDAFYEAAPDTASQVVERSEGVSGNDVTGGSSGSEQSEGTDGEYQSVLVTLFLDTDWTERDSTVAALERGADTMTSDSGRTATVTGRTAINEAITAELTGGILTTMIVALSAIVLVLTLVFRVMHGSATLGTVVAVPIALVVGMVIGGMYLLELPLNLTSALLMSLVIGLGVDYNIHLGDRFADELREGKSTFQALDAAVTGTGGALLGSTLTSAGAFTTLMLVPSSGIQGFGTIVVVALLTAFVVSIVVLPSVLGLWRRYTSRDVTASTSAPEGVAQD